MDDIVTRLRDQRDGDGCCVICGRGRWEFIAAACLRCEAADEIERLRGLLNRVYHLAVGNSPDFSVFSDWEDAISAYEEARRG